MEIQKITFILKGGLSEDQGKHEGVTKGLIYVMSHFETRILYQMWHHSIARKKVLRLALNR